MLQVGDLKCLEAIEKTEKIDWNERNIIGNTPIMTAIRNNKTEVVKFLLSHPKVDKSLKDSQGQTLLFLAKQKNNEELMELLKEVKEFSDILEKSNCFVVLIEVGPGKKRHGFDLRRNGCGYPIVKRVEDQATLNVIYTFSVCHLFFSRRLM